MPSPPPPKERKVHPAANLDALKDRPFHARVPPAHPMEETGHKPGKKTSPYDCAPEFHVQTLPPGSAPPDRTFYPPAASNILVPPEDVPELHHVGIEDMPGPTSKDLNKPFGRPVYGQTSEELHHDGRPKHKKEDVGLAKYGESEVAHPQESLGEVPPKYHPHHVAEHKETTDHEECESDEEG